MHFFVMLPVSAAFYFTLAFSNEDNVAVLVDSYKLHRQLKDLIMPKKKAKDLTNGTCRANITASPN